MHGITIPDLTTLNMEDLTKLHAEVSEALHKKGHRPKVNPDVIDIETEIARRAP